MKTIIELAREAGLADSAGVVHAHFQLERFAALHREAVIAELVAGSGEPVAYRTEDSINGVSVWLFKKTAVKYQDPPEALYTADQLAGAVLQERQGWMDAVKDRDAIIKQLSAAAIRSRHD